jgi:EPS-associated MarR family transcriptional regulator
MDENYLKTLRVLEETPSLSQRVLAERLKLSLGKANYLLNALINQGLVKAVHFKNSANKRSYMYHLTPEGMQRKLELTYQFIQLKSREYEHLQQEIETLKLEIENTRQPGALPQRRIPV